MIGANGDEQCAGGEAGDPIATCARAANIQSATIPRDDVRGDAVGLMQRHRPQILDGQAARHRGSSGNPERETKHVVTGGRHRAAMRQPRRADMAFIERDIAIHHVAVAVDHQLKAVRVLRAATHTRRCVRRQPLRL